MTDDVRAVAASIVRLDGGCESGHKPGQWHIHEEPFHALGRRLADALAASQPPSGDPYPWLAALEAEPVSQPPSCPCAAGHPDPAGLAAGTAPHALGCAASQPPSGDAPDLREAAQAVCAEAWQNYMNLEPLWERIAALRAALAASQPPSGDARLEHVGAMTLPDGGPAQEFRFAPSGDAPDLREAEKERRYEERHGRIVAAIAAATPTVPAPLDLAPTCHAGPNGPCDDETCRGHAVPAQLDVERVRAKLLQMANIAAEKRPMTEVARGYERACDELLEWLRAYADQEGGEPR